MKKSGWMILALVLMAVSSYGQSTNSLAVMAGYSMSAFEDQDDAAGTVPLGIQLGMMVSPNLQVGLEGNYLLGGFIWESKDEDYKLKTTFSQAIASAYAKLFLGQGSSKPFVKGGVGYFMGDVKATYEADGEEEDETYKIDPAIGFIVGGGINLSPNLFIEFNYNLVNRQFKDDGDKMEEENSEKLGMNSWSVMLGYKLNL